MPICRDVRQPCASQRPASDRPQAYHPGSNARERERYEAEWQAVNGPRCSATTKAGKPCRALAGADGLCTAPNGKTNMRELGRKGGKGRRSLSRQLPEPERQSLRQYLREQVDPSEVRLALKAALESGSQTAVVSAARLLVTELYEERPDEDRKADMQRANAQAKARLAELLATRARVDEPRRISDLLEEVAERLQVDAVDEHPPLVVGDVGAERAAAILAALEERG
jgi:hypothetical protein